MTVVVDASVAVSALVDDGVAGRWADSVMAGPQIVAPHLLMVEVAAALRGQTLGGKISAHDGREALDDAARWELVLYPERDLLSRVWELRDNLTAYDACYVALAELLDAPLATRDQRLADASGPRCEFLLPR